MKEKQKRKSSLQRGKAKKQQMQRWEETEAV